MLRRKAFSKGCQDPTEAFWQEESRMARGERSLERGFSQAVSRTACMHLSAWRLCVHAATLGFGGVELEYYDVFHPRVHSTARYVDDAPSQHSEFLEQIASHCDKAGSRVASVRGPVVPVLHPDFAQLKDLHEEFLRRAAYVGAERYVLTVGWWGVEDPLERLHEAKQNLQVLTALAHRYRMTIAVENGSEPWELSDPDAFFEIVRAVPGLKVCLAPARLCEDPADLDWVDEWIDTLGESVCAVRLSGMSSRLGLPGSVPPGDDDLDWRRVVSRLAPPRGPIALISEIDVSRLVGLLDFYGSLAGSREFCIPPTWTAAQGRETDPRRSFGASPAMRLEACQGALVRLGEGPDAAGGEGSNLVDALLRRTVLNVQSIIDGVQPEV